MGRTGASLHLAAAREALRAHQDLQIDASRRVDPFEALQKSNVVVIRRRLEHLAGAYLPGTAAEGRPDGVLINAAHPLSKQRFTAAHELAHHRRDRTTVLDSDTDWFGRSTSVQSPTELFAESFAAWFLMPKALVTSTLARLGVRPHSLDGRSAYALALELGTSYRATVQHLGDMGLIRPDVRRRLLTLQPRAIKRQVEGSESTADSWRDVWEVGSPHEGGRVWPIVGDALVFSLKETPASGYLWELAEVPDWLELVESDYSASAHDLVGGRGQRRLVFRVNGRGHQAVTLKKVRPWQPATVAEHFQIDVAAQPKPEPGEVEPELLAAAGS